MRFQNALDNARLGLLIALGAFALSFILNLFLGYGLMTVPNKITVHIPPRIPDAGINLKANEIPDADIYAFTIYIWQSLYYWPTNGADDYRLNLSKLSPCLTPHFLAFLKQDYNNRLNQGELQSRISTMLRLNSAAYEPTDVEYVGNNTWIVHLSMHLTERMNINDQTVKDTEIKYSLRVVRYLINSQKNPWGLAIDGFTENPERIKTVV